MLGFSFCSKKNKIKTILDYFIVFILDCKIELNKNLVACITGCCSIIRFSTYCELIPGFCGAGGTVNFGFLILTVLLSPFNTDVYKRQVLCGGRGLARGSKLLLVFFIIVSKSVCDLYCNWSLSMLFGCVVWCLYISNCSVVLSFRPLGK